MNPEIESKLRRWNAMSFGIVLVAALDVVAGLLGAAINGVHGGYWILGFFFYFGAFQLLWTAPVAIYFRLRGMDRALRGALLAMAIPFLLNATCFGVFALSR